MSYASAYGATRPLSAGQKAAEVVCERQARHRGEALPPAFWATPAWSRTYRAQVQAAARLLKLYEPEALFEALRRNPGVRSLAPGWVADLVRAEQDRVDARLARAAEAPPPPQDNAAEPPRPGLGRGGLKGKLKGL